MDPKYCSVTFKDISFVQLEHKEHVDTGVLSIPAFKKHFYSSFTKLNKSAQFIFKISGYFGLELKTGFQMYISFARY